MIFIIFSSKQLRRLIIPLIVEQLLAVLVGMVDAVMIAGVGESAVSGISIVDSINILIINIFAALSTGGAVVASQYIGRQEIHNAKLAAKQLVWITAGVSALFCIIALFLNVQILELVYSKLEPDVMEYSKTYFYLSAISYPFIGVYNACAAIVRAQGNSKVSMVSSLIMNAINVTLNAIFIFGFNLEVFGAGLSTLIARATACVIMLVIVTRKSLLVHIEQIYLPQLKAKMVLSILKIGVPNGLENSMFQLGKILVQGIVTTFGTVAITANAVASSIAGMECIPGMAIGMALVTVMGQCVGAKEFEQGKKYTIKLMKITYVATAVLNIAILLIANPIVSIYNLSPETSALAVEMLITHGGFAIIFWPAAFTLPNALRAAGDARFTMIISIASMWTFRIVLAYIFAVTLNIGPLGIWLAMICDWVFRAILFIWRFLSGKWKTKALFKDEAKRI